MTEKELEHLKRIEMALKAAMIGGETAKKYLRAHDIRTHCCNPDVNTRALVGLARKELRELRGGDDGKGRDL